MNQPINAVTIAVKDIKAMRKFYHDILEWPILNENPQVVMIRMNNAVLTLCAFEVFTEYTGLHPDSNSGKGCYLTINVDSPKRVDESFKKLSTQNVNITKMPFKTFWGGYSGFFADPEGNTWEISHNPIPGTKV